MKHLILYDGVCGLCNGLVQFVLPRDRKDRFRFAALQSNLAREVLKKFHEERARSTIEAMTKKKARAAGP